MLSLVKMLLMEQPDCEAYCRERRYERFRKHGAQIRFLKLHSFMHALFVPLLTINRKMLGKRLVILRDARTITDRPQIFCPTHIGGIDIEIAIEAIKHPCWIVIGDPRELYRNFSGVLLEMNGWVPLDTLTIVFWEKISVMRDMTLRTG